MYCLSISIVLMNAMIQLKHCCAGVKHQSLAHYFNISIHFHYTVHYRRNELTMNINKSITAYQEKWECDGLMDGHIDCHT